MNSTVELTKYLQVSNSAHILYLFEERNIYLKNLITYIKTGIERDHHVFVIENADIYTEVMEQIKHLYCSEKLNSIHFIDNYQFYDCYGEFKTSNIIQHFSRLLEPLLSENMKVRTWARVLWNTEQKNIPCILKKHEKMADSALKGMGIMSVCAYNALEISASLQAGMMRNHEYFMTDKEFVTSPLYSNEQESVIDDSYFSHLASQVN